jgi:hypothetical protein
VHLACRQMRDAAISHSCRHPPLSVPLLSALRGPPLMPCQLLGMLLQLLLAQSLWRHSLQHEQQHGYICYIHLLDKLSWGC